MGRFYSIPFDAVSCTAGQDLWEVLAGAAKPFFLHEVVFGQDSDYGDAQAEGLRILIKRATSTYNTGAGGTSPSVRPHLTNDAAAGVTAKANDVNQATAGSGGLVTVRAEGFNVQAGYQYLPTPETRFFFLPTEACIVSLHGGAGTAGPADALVCSGTFVFEEM